MCSNFAQKILLLHYWVSPKDFILTFVDLYFFEVPEKSEINQKKSIVLSVTLTISLVARVMNGSNLYYSFVYD